MEIQQEDNGNRGEFYVTRDGSRVARMVYSWRGTDRMIIEHTEVGEVLKGQGAGRQMVMKAVEFAREKHIKIVPLCPFARTVFDKTAEIRDVL
jgi:predicted GNAT family acetyltransferase